MNNDNKNNIENNFETIENNKNSTDEENGFKVIKDDNKQADEKEIKNKKAPTELFHWLTEPFWKYLQDTSVTEIQGNYKGMLFKKTLNNENIEVESNVDIQKYEMFLMLAADMCNKIINEDHPTLTDVIYINGERFRIAASVSPISKGPDFAIRRFSKFRVTLDKLEKDGTIPEGWGSVIYDVIDQGKNILIAGSTGSGKTTLLNAILDVARKNTKRFVVLEEDAAEIDIDHNNVTMLQNSASVSLQELVKHVLRVTPDRLIIGEIRDEIIAKCFYDSMVTGHKGSMATIHAGNALEATQRMTSLLSEKKIPADQICKALNIVIHIEQNPNSSSGRMLTEISSLDYDFEKNQIIVNPLV